MKPLTIRELPCNLCDERRFRVEGGTLAADWQDFADRHLCEGWCVVTIRNGYDYLASFHGAVWPSAWPQLFETGPMRKDGQLTRVLPAFWELLASSKEVAP